LGNLTVDSVVANLSRARAGGALARLSLQPKGFALLTLHRRSNVDDPTVFGRLLDAIEHLEFLQLQDAAALVLTDSGGVQEETTVLGTPCLTVRENTERPITITEGTNTLVGTSPEKIIAAIDQTFAEPRAGRVPELWNGHAGARAAVAIDTFLTRRGV